MLGLRKLPTVMAATTMALTVTGSRVSAKDLKISFSDQFYSSNAHSSRSIKHKLSL